jgi:plastocyanin
MGGRIMRRAFTLTAALGAVIVLGGGSQASGRATKTVELGDNFFNPPSMTIKQGATIDFTWIGEDVHEVTQSDQSPGKYFNSGFTDDTGFVYPHQFKRAGNYVILCTLHEDMVMNLKVKKRRR